MKMTVELFDNIINTSQDCVFWKDSERRFLGVNQAFLDFYGFQSADILIGKTDEDMGWHSNPEPYKQDELRVLSGETTYKVQGKCFIRGEERDIIASKRPLYDGEKIVGLVGSFVDITDVLKRQNRVEGMQIVYTMDSLRRIPYFDRLLDETGLEEILDPLTGIVNRVYSMDFVHSLIAAGTPFSFAIVDLDNFKFINDSFGHSSGDIVLESVTESLAEYVGDKGIVGRFGGDELLIVNTVDTEYEEKKKFFEKMYDGTTVLRNKINLESGSTLVTCTSGCASFPSDAHNFGDLFGLIDKTLYLGKSKGRNCYIIYVEEKHKDIEIKKLIKHNIYSDMISMRMLFEKGETLREKLSSVLTLLTDCLQIKDLYYSGTEEHMYSVTDESFDEDVSGISKLVVDELYLSSSTEDIRKNCEALYEVLKQREIQKAMIVRMQKDNEQFGFLICGVNRRFRIWQDNECALMYFLASLVSDYCAVNKSKGE